MKLFGLTFGPVDRPDEGSLKDIVDASNERLGQSYALQYTPDDFGQCDFSDAVRAERDADSLTKLAPDDGFVTKPATGGVRWPW